MRSEATHRENSMKPILAAAAALALLMLSGCSTTPISPTDASPVPPDRVLAFKQPGSGVPLTVTRDSGFVASACAVDVYVNGAIAAHIRQGESVTFHIPAGETIVGAQICFGALVERQAQAVPGKPLWFRISYDAALGLHQTATR